MKAPDAALVRARAKAPLTDLQVLHLSHADLSCLRNLEACRQLRSLYAGANVLKDIDGISALQRLWRIDLSGNLLRQLRPLASFPALGFLNVERNQLRFEDLVCLRDVHILDLRLYGNRDLLGLDHDRAALIEYRMRIVALLPYVWSLDGHFVTSRERVQALETFDDLTLQLLGRHSEGQVSSLRFGSSSDVWGSALVAGDDLNSPVQEDTLKLLQDIEKQPTRNPEKQDLHRLRALSMFYDAESDVHNAYTQFAPQKHAACGKPQPKVHLARFQRLASRVQLEVCVLLAAHLEFRLPAKLLAEAVTIATLGEDELQTSWIEDLAQLPPYAIVALLSVVRSHMLEQLTATHRNQTTAEFAKPFDVQMWKSMPAIATTLLGSDRQRLVVEADTPDRLYVQRCAFAVSLLSRATLFPERPFADTARNDLVDLINVAKLARASSLESFEFTIPRVLVVDDDSTAGNIQKMSFRNPEREYRRPWSEKPPAAVHSPPDSEPPSQPTRRRRAPRPGEWLELRPKLHLKIRSVSVDGTFISATGVSGTELSQLVTIRTDQIARISSSMWRLADDDPVLLDNCMRHLGIPTNMKRGRLGKLHRDSEAFHKHGAMRNQGYPNRDVTTHDLQCIAGREEDRTVNTSRQLQPVEVFSSTDTLDSNYVLTSPALISVQNAVATKAFHQQRQNPAGLWNPIQKASFQVLPFSSGEPENNVALEKVHKPKSKPALTPEHNGDDWLELQKDMQALLGMRPRTPKASIDDTDCFMTSVPPNDSLDNGVTRDTPDDSANSPVGLSHAASSPSLISQPMSPVQSIPRSTAKPKKLAAISWRQVPTKPQLLVASSGVSASPQAAKLGHGLPTGLSDPSTEAPDISLSPRPWSSSSRAPVRLTRCQVSLPTLALLGTNQK